VNIDSTPHNAIQIGLTRTLQMSQACTVAGQQGICLPK